MELLYIYINQSQNNFLNEQEMHFSKEYEIEYNKQEKVLKITKNKQYYNIFKDNILENVSAIIGQNGAGKTTLLKTIYYFNLFGESDETREEYFLYNEDKNKKSKGIKIYKIKDRVIAVYQNINKDLVVYLNNKKLKYYDNDIDYVKKIGKIRNKQITNFIGNISTKNINFGYMVYTQNYYERVHKNYKKALEKITNVYVTNSSMNKDDRGYGTDLNVTRDIFLTRSTIAQIGQAFNSKNSLSANQYHENDDFNIVQKNLLEILNENKFNRLLMFRYINYTSKNKVDFYGNNINHIELFVEDNVKLLGKLKEKFKVLDKEAKPTFDIESKINYIIKNLNEKAEESKFDIIDNLKYNWAIEVMLVFREYLNEFKNKVNISNLVEVLSKQIKEIGSKKENINEYIKYYLNGLKEIEKLEQLINKQDQQYSNDFLPKSDTACKKNLIIKYESELWNEVGNFIEEQVNSDYSFTLKYLNIDFNLSSGEEATLDIFSWIYSLEFLNRFDKNILKSTEENILLLLDEVELYAHPEWQRHIVDSLVKNVSNIFKGKKVQVVFATHSPITLSDIPSDNVSAIKNGNIENAADGYTFGANIYDLYKKEFILSLSIGEYAKSKIDRVLEFLDNYKGGEKNRNRHNLNMSKKEAEYIINSIGEPILRKYLKSKLDTIEEGGKL